MGVLINTLVPHIDTALSNGYAVVRNYVSGEECAQITSEIFPKPYTEADNAWNGEIPNTVVTTKVINDIRDSFAAAGFSDWNPNRIYARQTEKGKEEHRDRPELRYGTALLYISGESRLQVRMSKGEQPTTICFKPGDMFIQRGPHYYDDDYVDEDQPNRPTSDMDERPWHKADDDTGWRAFVHLAYNLHGTVAYDLATRRRHFVD